MPVLTKGFKRLINKSLRLHIKPLIGDGQHEFTLNCSTVTNLTVYSDYITKCMDQQNDVHSIYTDFLRACDKVSHKLLLHKMTQQFRFENNTLLWFASYLSNRQQRVVLNGVESSWVDVTSGVAQWLILGPSLFLLYVNDLPQAIKSAECLLFADDAKLYSSVSSIVDCLLLQADINALSRWCLDWKISINLVKCAFVKFTNKRNSVFYFIYTIS